jgi:hypothetical protein
MGSQVEMFEPAPGTDARLPVFSFWRPWAESLVTGVKRLEFRPTKPPSTIIGKVLAVHATQKFHPPALEWLRVHCGVDWRARTPERFAVGIIGVVTITGYVRDASNPDFGDYAWTLEDPVAIPTVGWSGLQGVQYAPGHVATLVRLRVAAAREGRAP